MKKIIFIELILLLTLILSLNCYATEQTDEKENIYLQLCRAVIRLEHTEEILNDSLNKTINKNMPDGTAFFVQNDNDLFVVTARHVVEKDYDLHARVKCRSKKTGEYTILLLKLNRDKWIFHPEEQSIDTNYVDIAIMKIGWLKDWSIKRFRYELPNNENYHLNQLPLEDPSPPDCILIFGFPLNVGFKLSEQKPFGRLGIIAMVTGERFLKMENGKFAEPKTILIDSDMFPGNSGSPVIKQLTPLSPEIQLLGLVFASNEKANFAVIEPVSRIRETINIAKETPKNMECWHLID